ncbi:MAG: T9SS type A sorting domain-containing protein [Bacteroidota bacterium]
MKNFTPLLIFLIVGLFAPTDSLLAQADGCGGLDFTTAVRGVVCGAKRGGIDLTLVGGSGNYFIEWDSKDGRIWNRASSFFPFYSIESLPPGTYKIKVMDAKSGCFVKKEATVTTNELPENLEITPSEVACTGMGFLAIRIPTKNPPFNLNLRGPVNKSYLANSRNFRIFGLPAGIYEIDFVENDGCIATATTTIGTAAGLPELSVEAVMGGCNISTGAVKVGISGGVAGYTLSWKGPTSGEIFLDGSAEIPDFITGTYQFTLEDANGCQAFQSLTIDRSGLSVSLSTTQAKCNQNGAIRVDITAGIAPYTVMWRGGIGVQDSRTVEGNTTSLSLPAGTYVVEIKDAEGCSTFSSTTIVEQSTDLYCSITPTNTTCGLDNGAINVFISGGKKPYLLSYTGPVSGSATVNGTTTFSDLPAGTYTTFLQDADGCAVSESAVVEVGPTETAQSSFTFSATGTSVFFFNNSTPGSYAWTFGDGTAANEASPTKEYDSPGAYEVCLTTTGKCDANTLCQTIQLTALRNIGGADLQTDQGQAVDFQVGVGNGEAFKVIQNYPNPFVNQTDILFELPADLMTTITIFDNTGKVIRESTANYDQGTNFFTFHQDGLTAGVYYYTVRAGAFSTTKKMLVK